MTGILAEILAYKREFVAESKRRRSLRDLEDKALSAGRVREFAGAVERRSREYCALVAEIKTASPSKGIIREDFDPVLAAEVYEHNGAACISVLTDERYFMGSLDRLAAVRNAVKIPVLRKDFIIDPYQVYEARAAGADAVLLIAACLDDYLLCELIEASALLEMDVLLEVHDEAEMERAGTANVKLIGVNNRNLATFAVDLAVTERLALHAPVGALIVSESGITSREDVLRMAHAGARAVLVGETLVRAEDMAAKVRELAGTG